MAFKAMLKRIAAEENIPAQVVLQNYMFERLMARLVKLPIRKNLILKGGTSFIYGKMRRAGEVEDLGDKLWQRDYWDDLVTSEAEFKGWKKYIRENPANWSSDRYGACTAFALGDTELLNRPRIAFVASQGFFASELRPRKVWAKAGTAKAVGSDGEGAGDRVKAVGSDGEGAGDRVKAVGSDGEGAGGAKRDISKQAASAAAVLISTFTSAQEREALRLKRSLRDVVMIKYRLRDPDLFNKAYAYVEQYY